MDIALIIGVVLGMGAMIGSIAFELSKGAAGSFGNFISPASFGIVAGDCIYFCCIPNATCCCIRQGYRCSA